MQFHQINDHVLGGDDLLGTLKCCTCDERAKGKYLHPFSEEAYETLLLLVQGKFNVPVAERTRE